MDQAVIYDIVSVWLFLGWAAGNQQVAPYNTALSLSVLSWASPLLCSLPISHHLCAFQTVVTHSTCSSPSKRWCSINASGWTYETITLDDDITQLRCRSVFNLLCVGGQRTTLWTQFSPSFYKVSEIKLKSPGLANKCFYPKSHLAGSISGFCLSVTFYLFCVYHDALEAVRRQLSGASSLFFHHVDSKE